jgi:RNA polymerase sigma factor (sigma-70 family)
VLEQVFRDEWGRVLASLVGFLRDFDKAEEAAQEAFAIAAQHWPESGLPDNPGAWLVTTARNRAIDRIRRERTLAEKIHLLPVPEATVDEYDDTVIKDERLELIFTCCRPALPPDGQVALTLRALGGLDTAEIARAFLVSEQTMKRRLSRAKSKIKATGIPFAVPDARVLPERLDAVLAVIYLIYNEGYTGRVDLAAEAIRLGHVLSSLMPDRPEVHWLLALMMIHHARRQARFSGDDLVLLDDQDRALWDHPEIAAARRCSTSVSASAGAARTSCRPRSRPCRRPSTSTGRRSLRCTGDSSNSPARRSSSSTVPSPSPKQVIPPRHYAPSTASTFPATSISTPPAASCCDVSAATTRRERRTAVRSSWPRRPPSSGS